MTEANPIPPNSYKDPASVAGQDIQQGPSGLGGWLILVGIAIVLSPLRLGATSLQLFLPVFKEGTWELLTTPGSELYHALWAPIIIFEILGNLGFIAVYVVLGILFFRRSRRFPNTYIAVTLANLCFIVLDAWLSTFVLPDEPMFDPETSREVVRSIVSIGIWVPYMLVSKRVRNTFVR